MNSEQTRFANVVPRNLHPLTTGTWGLFHGCLSLTLLSFLLNSCDAFWQNETTDSNPSNRNETIPVAVDRRTELLSIVFRLIDAGEFKMPVAGSPYSKAVDDHFKRYKSHPTLAMARALREEEGIGFDAVASYAVHLRDVHSREFAVPLEPWPSTLDSRWTSTTAKQFADSLAEFVDDSKFEEFWDSQRDRRAIAEERMRETLSRRPYRQWIESFVGQSLPADSKVIVGMLIGGGNYGVSVDAHDKVAVFPTIGVWNWDEQGHPVFPDSVVDTIVHEFCHPFVNPIVDRHLGQFERAGKWLWERRADTMRIQAYGSPRTVLYESVVRGCVTHILKVNLGQEVGTLHRKNEIANSFLLTDAIVQSLDRYAANRDRFPTLDSYGMRLSKDVADASDNGSAIEASIPKIVSFFPGPDDKIVAPEVTVRIEFDRPMDISSRGLNFGDTKFDRVLPGSFDESGTVYTTTLRFPAGAQVNGWVNRFHKGLMTPDGFAASEQEIHFQIPVMGVR